MAIALGGNEDDPALPVVRVRFAGEIGAPLVVIPGAILTPAQAIEYAKAVFGAAAMACTQSREDAAGQA